MQTTTTTGSVLPDGISIDSGNEFDTYGIADFKSMEWKIVWAALMPDDKAWAIVDYDADGEGDIQKLPTYGELKRRGETEILRDNHGLDDDEEVNAGDLRDDVEDLIYKALEKEVDQCKRACAYRMLEDGKFYVWQTDRRPGATGNVFECDSEEEVEKVHDMANDGCGSGVETSDLMTFKEALDKLADMDNPMIDFPYFGEDDDD